jgi:hypothetical protein
MYPSNDERLELFEAFLVWSVIKVWLKACSVGV